MAPGFPPCLSDNERRGGGVLGDPAGDAPQRRALEPSEPPGPQHNKAYVVL